jgi:ankyrin repeat protein
VGTEELLGRKRELHVKGFESVVEELKVELEGVVAGKGTRTRRGDGGVERRLIEGIVEECKRTVERHRGMGAGEYTDAGEFRRLNEEMLEARRFGRSKLELWLEGGGKEGDVDLMLGPRRPMRTCHRLLISLLRTGLEAGGGEPEAEAAAALQLCVLNGLVRASPNEAANELGETPLMRAAADDASPNALRLLLRARADVNRATPEGFTAAYRAAQYGHAECLEVILGAAGVDIDKADNIGFTPVIVAAQNGHVECIQALKAAGADVDKAMNDGATPVWIAAQFGHAECIRALKAAGVDVDKAENDSIMPVYIAAQEGHVECLQALKAAGADVDKAINDGRTPVYIAAQYGHAECIRALKAAGANIHTPWNGLTPLAKAWAMGHLACVAELE